MKVAPKNHLKENKPQPSLIPIDLLMKYLEPGYREGLIKYYRESWRLGFTTSVMMDGAIRHLVAYYYGKEDYDPDAKKLGIKKHHLGGVLFCVLCMCDTFENHPEMDDRHKDWCKEKEDLEIKKTRVSNPVFMGMDFARGGIIRDDTIDAMQYMLRDRKILGPNEVHLPLFGKGSKYDTTKIG